MASFSYIAIDARGKEKKGAMEAIDESKVNASLRGAGLIPISIVPQSLLTKDINFNIGNPVKPRDLSVFCRQFCSILAAGVSITVALHMLEDQTEKKVLKKAVKELKEDVERGETLSDAMRRHGKIFPSILVNMIEAGEKSGSLEVSLERMAVHFEKDAKTKALLRKAMIYPIVIAIVATAAIIIMLAKVVPKFLKMFEYMDVKMPWPTQFVIDASNFLQNKWYILLAIIALIIGGIKVLSTLPSGEKLLARVALAIPIFGKLNKKTACARLARTLGTLLHAGISLVDALEIVARTMNNVIVKKTLLDAKDAVEKGIPLSVPLKDCGLYPAMIYQMINIGEETGNLEDMLECSANYYEEEVEVATESMAAILEPLIIVVLAVIVGFIVISILLPMVTMYKGMDNL